MKSTAPQMKSWRVRVLIGIFVSMLLFGVWYLRSEPATTFTVTVRDDVTSAPVPAIPVFLWDGSQHTFPGNVLARFKKIRLPIPSDSSGCVTLERPPNKNRMDRLRYKVGVVLPPNWQLISTNGELMLDDNVVVRIVQRTPQASPVAK